MVLFVIVLLWVTPILVAGQLTIQRGRGRTPGSLLGGFLSWIGVVIAACLSPIGPTQYPGRLPSMRACPYCAEPIQPAAIFCKWCRHDLRA